MESFTNLIRGLDEKYRTGGKHPIIQLLMDLSVLELLDLEPKREEIDRQIEQYAYLTTITPAVIEEYYDDVIEHCDDQAWISTLSENNKDLLTDLKTRKLQIKITKREETDFEKTITQMQKKIDSLQNDLVKALTHNKELEDHIARLQAQLR